MKRFGLTLFYISFIFFTFYSHFIYSAATVDDLLRKVSSLDPGFLERTEFRGKFIFFKNFF